MGLCGQQSIRYESSPASDFAETKISGPLCNLFPVVSDDGGFLFDWFLIFHPWRLQTQKVVTGPQFRLADQSEAKRRGSYGKAAILLLYKQLT